VAEILGPKAAEVRAALARNRAGHARVFGSVGRGSAGSDSDLDLLVEFEEGASLLDQFALTQDLERILKRKVDVTTTEGLHWILRPQVLVEAVPL
jgi:uncharacterized protein